MKIQTIKLFEDAPGESVEITETTQQNNLSDIEALSDQEYNSIFVTGESAEIDQDRAAAAEKKKRMWVNVALIAAAAAVLYLVIRKK